MALWLGATASVSAATALAAPAGTTPAATAAPSAQVFDYGRFGAITVYGGNAEARDVVLFLSGDGGWNLGVVTMARLLTAQHAVVAGIDIRHYLHELEHASEKCVSPAVDFENLSRHLQSTLKLKNNLQPMLVGYSSGATLVYATLVESPEGLFKGALSVGFCPDLDLKKPVCKGAGLHSSPRLDAKGHLQGVNFLAATRLSGKWISLQGEADQVCPAAETKKFIAAVPGGEIVMLPKVGHGYSVERNWVPQYQAAFARIAAAPSRRSTAALPATDVP